MELADCVKTIYNLIDRDKRRKSHKILCRRRKQAITPGRSTENRPEQIKEGQENQWTSSGSTTRSSTKPYKVAFRKKIYRTLDDPQLGLDE